MFESKFCSSQIFTFKSKLDLNELKSDVFLNLGIKIKFILKIFKYRNDKNNLPNIRSFHNFMDKISLKEVKRVHFPFNKK